MTAAATAYEEKKQRLAAQLQARHGRAVRLEKDTSNLFRDRKDAPRVRLNVRQFNEVLAVDPQAGYAEVEGMTPYAKLVDACLPHGVMPSVVPELKSITVGGAVTGVGIESSSFKYGLVHETVQELEVLLADGSTVVCSPDSEHSDLFYGFPNSYGTLGYALRVRVKVVPIKPNVRLIHIRHSEPHAYFEALRQWCDRDVDFVDGTVFGPKEMYLTVGELVEEAPYTSDYGYERIYYRSIRERELDYLTIKDYIWRWDTDWFWCSKNLYAQNPVVRRLLGRERLNSVTYTKIMRWNARWGLTRHVNRLLGLHTESVIQDIEVPVGRASQFMEFYFEEIGFTPVWICPTRAWDKEARFELYPMDPEALYVNFGFWDVIKGRRTMPKGHYNRRVEDKVVELGGIKSLYSDSYFTPEQFWALYNKPAYDALRRRYDPQGVFKDIYTKCVLRE